MEIKIKIKPVYVPTHVTLEIPSYLENGLSSRRHSTEIKLSDLDVETLSELCDQFRKDAFKEACKVDPNPPTVYNPIAYRGITV